MGVTYIKNRVCALLEYICHQMPDIQLRKLLKVLYLIDEKSVQLRAIPVTWLDYYAWQKGPVAPDVYAVKDGAFADCVTCHRGLDNKWHVSANKIDAYAIDRDLKVFSEFEMDIINSVVAHCQNKSADDLTDETHSCDSLWSQTVTRGQVVFDEYGRSNCPICLNDLNTEDGKEIYEEARDCMMMQLSVNSSANV